MRSLVCDNAVKRHIFHSQIISGPYKLTRCLRLSEGHVLLDWQLKASETYVLNKLYTILGTWSWFSVCACVCVCMWEYVHGKQRVVNQQLKVIWQHEDGFMFFSNTFHECLMAISQLPAWQSHTHYLRDCKTEREKIKTEILSRRAQEVKITHWFDLIFHLE